MSKTNNQGLKQTNNCSRYKFPCQEHRAKHQRCPWGCPKRTMRKDMVTSIYYPVEPDLSSSGPEDYSSDVNQNVSETWIVNNNSKLLKFYDYSDPEFNELLNKFFQFDEKKDFLIFKN
jgi:hypothetical protein